MRAASIIAFLLLTGYAFVFESCCKEKCVDDEIFAIDFMGFHASEMEKIKVLQYEQNNFVSPVDSYYVSSNNILIKDTSRVYLDRSLASNFDFKIRVEKAGLDYTLSEFQTQKRNCRCGPGTSKEIIGYSLNGVHYSALNKYAVEIKK